MLHNFTHNKYFFLSFLLVACGGGGGSSSTPEMPSSSKNNPPFFINSISEIEIDELQTEVVTVEADDEENWAEIKTWYETNQDSEERPTMQFPVGILFDEESLVIENQEEMRSAYQECYPKRDGEWSRDGDETCFYLVSLLFMSCQMVPLFQLHLMMKMGGLI